MKRFKLTYYLLVTVTFLMCLSGCSEDNGLYINESEGRETVNAQLLLTISVPKNNTRADSNLTLSGTDSENAINKVTLFIIDSTTGTQVSSVEGSNLDQKTLVFFVGTTEGTKQIYVGANMSDQQIEAIKTSGNPVLTLTSNINEVTENGFVMTAQAFDLNGSNSINIIAHKETKITATLKRVVSKVLLTCESRDDEHVVLSNESKGYIKLSDVHYTLDTTNKKFYAFEKSNNEDPNYSMTNTIGHYDDNFFKFIGNVEESTNVAIKYDANRLSETDNKYYEGIYCLENTVNIDYNYENDLSIPKEVATYIKIAAKFTPMYIDGESQLTEQQAIEKLQYNKGTFYTCKKAPANKKYICYSSIDRGIAYLGNNFLDKDFVKHEGGWQYYETFVASSTAFTETSNLRRNNYYIANVTSFTAPIQDKTIEVNTTIVEWSVKGRTTIDIETSK